MKSTALLLLAFTSIVYAAPPVLWPKSDSIVEALTGTTMTKAYNGTHFSFESNAAWPGALVKPKHGAFDLSRCAVLEIAVSNTLPYAQTLHVKFRLRNNPSLISVGSGRIEAKSKGNLICAFDTSLWRLDKSLPLNGLRGAPQGPEGRKEYAAVKEIHIFRKNRDRPIKGGFTLCSITERPSDLTRPLLRADTFLPFIDKYGQFRHADWPGKIHSDEDLIAARIREEEWLKENAAGPLADIGRYGGWTKGPRYKATGRFYVKKINGRWWFIDPEGYIFFSFGIVSIRPGEPTLAQGRESWFEGLPSGAKRIDHARLNMERKYGEKIFFNARTHRRLRAWGINTIGNWSSLSLRAMRRTPYVADLTTSGRPIEGAIGWSGKKFPDPFDATFRTHLNNCVKEEAMRSGADPWCLGWFVDNELPWSNDSRGLARGVIASPADQPAKTAARRYLESRYKSIAALNKAWGTTYGNWDDFLTQTTSPPEKRSRDDLDAIQKLVTEEYFRSVSEAIKKEAPGTLYLGCRFSNGSPNVWKTAAEFCDVVSANIYRKKPTYNWPKNAIDKPLIISEFHFGACDRGHFSHGLEQAENNAERAKSFGKYVCAALIDPRIVGVHWFKWCNQPVTGRGLDGENFPVGFVDICDTPDERLVNMARLLAKEMYKVRLTRGYSRTER